MVAYEAQQGQGPQGRPVRRRHLPRHAQGAGPAARARSARPGSRRSGSATSPSSACPPSSSRCSGRRSSGARRSATPTSSSWPTTTSATSPTARATSWAATRPGPACTASCRPGTGETIVDEAGQAARTPARRDPNRRPRPACSAFEGAGTRAPASSMIVPFDGDPRRDRAPSLPASAAPAKVDSISSRPTGFASY